MQSSSTNAPLSSLRYIPATETTVAKLRAAGIEAPPGLSEHGAQALLAVHEDVQGDESGAPGCYQARFTPTDPLCLGCVYAPRCWRSDLGYLHRLGTGEATPPEGVPPQVVASRVEYGATRADPGLPPVVLKRPPPPPPPPRRAT